MVKPAHSTSIKAYSATTQSESGLYSVTFSKASGAPIPRSCWYTVPVLLIINELRPVPSQEVVSIDFPSGLKVP